MVWTFETLREQGPADLPLVLRRRDRGRSGRRARRRVPLQVGRQPRAAADPRPDAGAVEEILGGPAISPRRRSEPPLGSGPYKVEAFEPGRSITYRRVPDYWGARPAGQQGRNNVDTIRYDTTATDGRARGVQGRAERRSARELGQRLGHGYDCPALREGPDEEGADPEPVADRHAGLRLQSAPAVVPGPAGAPGAGLWVRLRVVEQEPVLRRLHPHRAAISTIASCRDRRAAGRRAEILEQYRGKIPDEVFTKEYNPPKYRRLRQYPRRAARGAEAAEGGRLERQERASWSMTRPASRSSSRSCSSDPAIRAHRAAVRAVTWSAWASPRGSARSIPAQYQKRMDDLRLRHDGRRRSASRCRRATSSAITGACGRPTRRAAATCSGSGTRSIDELIEKLIQAPDRASLVAHTRALDRVLQWGYHVIPNCHLPAFRVAYWDKFGRPEVSPKYGLGFDSWWVDPKAEQTIEAKKGEAKQ